MNPQKKQVFLLLLTVLAGVILPLMGNTTPTEKNLHTLYSPLTFVETLNEYSSFLNLQPPQAPHTSIDFPFPFYEPWDQGMFSFYDWQFSPSQSNWAISASQGNPAPTAVFNGNPGIQNYEARLISHTLYGKPWVCANMYLEFDYKLTDVVSGGTEKLEAAYYIDNMWYPVDVITNQGSTGWVHQKIDISQVCGKEFSIGFMASGSNSTNIASWAVDNIKAYGECKPPVGCDHTKSGNIVHLFWQPPQCDSLQVVAGYYVYRAECLPILYTIITPQPIQGLECFDTITPAPQCDHYWYSIAAIHMDPFTNTILCLAECDSIMVDVLQGIVPEGNPGISIFPNPASDYFSVQSNSPVGSCELLNFIGQPILSVPSGNQTACTIPVSTLPPGIYLVRIKNASGTLVKKVSVMH